MMKLKIHEWEMDIPVNKPSAMMAAAWVWEILCNRENRGARDVGKEWQVRFGTTEWKVEICEYTFGPQYFVLWGVENGQMITIVGDALCVRYR